MWRKAIEGGSGGRHPAVQCKIPFENQNIFSQDIAILKERMISRETEHKN